jgi:hypothetical protein
MDSRPTPVNSVLHQQLQSLTAAARRHERATALVRETLSTELAGHLRGATVSGETLTLYVDSPSWATRMRFQAPSLLRQLPASGLAVRHCQIRVQPPGDVPRPARVQPRRARVSASAADSVRSAADAAESPGLAAALRRLASTLVRR